MTVPTTVAQWKNLAEKYASLNPPLLANEILAIIWSESTGNPSAANPNDPSWGLMQVTLYIAHKFAGVSSSAQLMDPETNVKIGAAFLAYLKRNYAEKYPLTDPNCAWVAAYNEGEPNLWKKRPDPAYIAAFVNHLLALNAMDAEISTQ